MRLVRVVTSTRSFFFSRSRISCSKSSTWPFTGRTSTCGSTRPVGRMICSTTTPPESLSSSSPGVAETNRIRGTRRMNSSIRSGRLSSAEEPEAVVHERLLAGAVSFEHPAELGQRLVRLVDDAEVIIGEVVEQARGALAHRATREVPRIVLDAGAAAHLEQHVDVEVGAGLEALGFEQLVLNPQLGEALLELGTDRHNGALDGRPLGDEVSS